MRAAMLTLAILSSAALAPAALECAAGTSLESSLCKDLQGEASSSLELLQHGQHSAVKGYFHDTTNVTVEETPSVPEVSPEAAQALIVAQLRNLTRYVAQTDILWRKAKEDLGAAIIRKTKADHDLHTLSDAQDLHRQNNQSNDFGSMLLMVNEQHKHAIEEAGSMANERALQGMSAALHSPAEWIQSEVKDDGSQAKPVDMSLFLLYAVQDNIRKSSGKSLTGSQLEVAKGFTKAAVKADEYWKRAMNEVERTTLEAMSLKAILLDIKNSGKEMFAPGVKLSAEHVPMIDDIFRKAKKAVWVARQVAEQKATKKVSADTTLDTFEWLMKQREQ